MQTNLFGRCSFIVLSTTSLMAAGASDPGIRRTVKSCLLLVGRGVRASPEGVGGPVKSGHSYIHQRHEAS
jgi:hypothetical protein